MYSISVLAMFKNESIIIKEWLEHYLAEGVQHFYLKRTTLIADFFW